MNKQYDVTAMGELLIDFTPSGVNDQGMSLFARNPGGAPANVLAMNTKLGGNTAFIGKVGQDDFGRFLRGTLEEGGIDVTGLVMSSEVPTTLAFVQLTPEGDRSFSFYRKPGADMMLTANEVNRELITGTKIFHFGSVSLTDDPCRTAVHTAVAFAREQNKIISYDPNYRPLLWDSEERAKAEILKLAPQADILKVSEEEMTLLTGETDLGRGADVLAAMGAAIVLVSLGPKGAFYRCNGGSGILPTYDVRTVDTTGAGDAFLGVVHYRLRNHTAAQLRQLTGEELADMVDFANAAGSLTTAKRGAIPAMPTAQEIEACRKTVPPLLK